MHIKLYLLSVSLIPTLIAMEKEFPETTNPAFLNEYTYIKVQDPLVDAIQKGFPGIAKILIKSKFNVNSQNNGSRISPLMAAAQKGNCELIKLLTDNGASLELKDASEKTALEYAISFDQKKALKILLQEGALIFYPGDISLSPCYHALKSNNFTLLKCLYSNCLQMLETDHGALLQAIAKNDYKEALTLIQSGVDINQKDKFGHSALWYAIHFKHAKMIALLLSYNASDADIIIKESNLQSHNRSKVIDTLQILETLSQKEAREYRTDKTLYTQKHIELLKQKKYRRFHFNQTLLIWATILNDLDTVQALLELNLPSWYVNAKDSWGNTALSYAIKLDNNTLVKILLKSIGRGLYLKNNYGNSALELATLNNNKNLVTQIIQENKLNTPALLRSLQIALKKGYQDILTIIIKKLVFMRPTEHDKPINQYSVPEFKAQTYASLAHKNDSQQNLNTSQTKKSDPEELFKRVLSILKLDNQPKEDYLEPTAQLPIKPLKQENPIIAISAKKEPIYLKDVSNDTEPIDIIDILAHVPHLKSKEHLYAIIKKIRSYKAAHPHWPIHDHDKELLKPLFEALVIEKYYAFDQNFDSLLKELTMIHKINEWIKFEYKLVYAVNTGDIALTKELIEINKINPNILFFKFLHPQCPDMLKANTLASYAIQCDHYHIARYLQNKVKHEYALPETGDFKTIVL